MASIRGSGSKAVVVLLQLAVLLFALLAAGSCTREPEAPLRVGTNVWPGYEPLYLARELGYFQEGNIRLVEYSSATEVINAFRNGEIEAAALTLDELLLLSGTTPDVAVILVLDFSHGADVILGQTGVKSLRDLKGKRVGLETTALGAYMLTRALQSVGMSPDDVRLVSLEISEHERAFREGRVDAVVTFEPVKGRLLAGGARQLFDSSLIPGEIVDVLVVRRTSVEKQRGQIGRLVSGWFRALGFIGKEAERATSLMAKREHISAADFQKSLRGLKLPDLAENRALLAGPHPAIVPVASQLGRMMAANRLMERSPEATTLFDGRFVTDTAP